MRKIILKDAEGKTLTAYAPETNEELEAEILANKKQNLKEHLYMGYLIVGTLAFTLGIYISIKRINGKS